MRERASERGCARANDLVAFLYDEIDEQEVRDFELHLQNCSECTLELRGFRQMRQSIVAWRDECLSVTPASLVGRHAVDVSVSSELVLPNKRSAVAAVRQFFALSPLWLKGAVAFASVLFCVVAALAVSQLLQRSQPATVAIEKLYTEKELEAKIEERMQSLAQLSGRTNEVTLATKVNINNKRQASNSKAVRRFGNPVFNNPSARRRPLTKSEREQLAADLRLTSAENEETLDLLDDSLSK